MFLLLETEEVKHLTIVTCGTALRKSNKHNNLYLEDGNITGRLNTKLNVKDSVAEIW